MEAERRTNGQTDGRTASGGGWKQEKESVGETAKGGCYAAWTRRNVEIRGDNRGVGPVMYGGADTRYRTNNRSNNSLRTGREPRFTELHRTGSRAMATRW